MNSYFNVGCAKIPAVAAVGTDADDVVNDGWNRSKTIMLIRAYRKYPVLYLQRLTTDKRNSQAKVEAMRRISLETGFPVVAIERKICTLRSQYFRELVKIRRSRQGGRARYSPVWYAFRMLTFLGGEESSAEPQCKLRSLLTRGSTSQDAEHVSIPPPSTSAAVSFLAPPSLADGKDDNLSAQEQVTQELWDNQQAILREIQSTHTPTDAESESFADYNYDNSSAADQAETFGLSAADHCQAEALGLSLPDHGQAEGSMSDAMERPGGVMSDSLELFGRYVASILRQLPITTSYSLQQKFINEAISARLEYEGNGHSPTPGSPTAPRSQPARSKVNVDATAVSDKTSTNKSSKKRDKVHKTLASNEPQQITSVIIKQEVLDDADISEAVEENTSCHMVDDSSSGIDIEEGPLKQEVQSDFEVLCKDPQTPSLEVNSLKLLQALAGETSRKAQDSTPQPLLTCSFCGSKFFKTSDLNQHLRDKHGGGPSVGHKPIKEGTCAKRPRLTSSANQNNVSVTQTPGDITESLIQTLATTSAPTAVTVPSYTSSVNPPVFVPFRNYSAPVSLSNQPTAPGTKAPHVFDDRPS